ncbi:Imm50 family immunity protein [Streptomyces sp. NPDC059989]|uniref:Imm50 family immunity protein n=1 Tax=Streptomyces sp. NPDC059989 TaxID=3347026 RepID=UPI00367FB453
MSPSSWPEIAALYDVPPDLSSCPLYSVHVDERDTSVTLGFETSHLPDHPDPQWAASRYNTFVFFVLFTGVEELRMAGIAAEHPDSAERVVRVGEASEAGVRWVSANSETRSISFSAAASAVVRTRVYLQGSL